LAGVVVVGTVVDDNIDDFLNTFGNCCVFDAVPG
jgi:hypothetical protein